MQDACQRCVPLDLRRTFGSGTSVRGRFGAGLIGVTFGVCACARLFMINGAALVLVLISMVELRTVPSNFAYPGGSTGCARVDSEAQE